MKIKLTYKALKEIIEDWDIEYINNDNKPAGEIDHDNYKIIINANQSVRESGVTILHEFLHLIYQKYNLFHTELQLDEEAKYYYEKTDFLDYIYSFL